MTIFGNRDSGYGSSARSPTPSRSRRRPRPADAPTRGFGAPDTASRHPARARWRDIVVGSAEGREQRRADRPRHGAPHRAGLGARASGLRSTSGSSVRARSSRSTSNAPNNPFEGRRTTSPASAITPHYWSRAAAPTSPERLEDRRGPARARHPDRRSTGPASGPFRAPARRRPDDRRRGRQIGTAPNRDSALVLAAP